MDDDTLMRQAASGDPAAFGRIVQAYQRPLTRFAERMLGGDVDRSSDVVQEALLRLWRFRARYQPEGRLRSLLFRIVRNACLDAARLSRPVCSLESAIAQSAPDTNSPEAACQARAIAEAVRCAVMDLPEPQRTVFVLSQYEQLGYAEIAEIVGCPLGTVASRKRLAVAALRHRLREWMEDYEP